MDHLTGRPPPVKPVCISDRMRAKALDAGILPDDPLGPLVDTLGDIPEEVEARIAPLLAQIAILMAKAEQAANRPLLSGHQVRYDVLPVLVSTVGWAKALVGAVLLFGVFWLGWGAHWWQASELTCGAHMTGSGRPICFRFDGPETAPQQQQPAAPLPATTPKGKPG
jgi:hypothetical protein